MIDIDLLKREKRKEVRARPKAPGVSIKVPFNVATVFAIGLIVLLVIVLGVIYITQMAEINKQKDAIKRAQIERAKLQDKIDLINDLTQREAKLKVKFGVIEALDKGKFFEPKLLEELSKSLPEYCWINSISEGGGIISLEGTAFSNMTVAEFMERLSLSPSFQNVELSMTQRVDTEGKQTVKFVISANTTAVQPVLGGSAVGTGGGQ